MDGDHRPAAVAGRFYDRDAQRLRRQLTSWLGEGGQPSPVPALRGLIVPHAGHIYSGAVAARAYRLLDPPAWQRILLLGPAHFVPVAGVAASSATGWTSPLGTVPLATECIADLVAAGLAEYDDVAHEPEHCLEVQLPFLQLALPGAWRLLPMLVGHADPEHVADLIDAAVDEATLLLISTDLSHYLPYDRAVRSDTVTAERICARSPEAIDDRDACGAYALRGALTWCRRHDVSVTLLDLRNSGDTAGDPQRVVGYGAFALHGGSPRSD